MNIDSSFHDLINQGSQGGLASWEEPRLPLAQRVQRQWRQMLVHLWGPAGSVAFHVVAVGALIVFTTGTRPEYVPSGEVFIPSNYKEPPLETPPALPATRQENLLPMLVTPTRDNADDQPGRSLVGSDTDDAGSGTQPDGSSLGTGPSSLPKTGFEISDSVIGRLHIPGLVSGSTAGGRNDRLRKYIASHTAAKENENAVLRSLRWLKREQQSDGAWIGSKQNVPPAMTSLALLTFLAHDETPDSAEFGATVKRGIGWLLANQEADGHFRGRDSHDYTQPIAAYALCEAYTLTGHPLVKEAAVKAVTLVVTGQHASGGFNYNLDQSLRNDSSYMAWCCQALKAARMAKLQDDVPGLEAAIKKGIAGFRFNADPNGGFGYDNSGRTGLSGAGTLCLQLLGAPNAPEVLNTLKFLDACTFSFATPDQQPYGGDSPLYYWYYITQAKFNHGKETFTPWEKQFSPELRRMQVIEKNAIPGLDGKPVDVGHWESPGKGEHTGGVVQDTALCTLMLEVYYRYLSTSQHVDIDADVLANGAKPDDAIAIQIR